MRNTFVYWGISLVWVHFMDHGALYYYKSLMSVSCLRKTTFFRNVGAYLTEHMLS